MQISPQREWLQAAVRRTAGNILYIYNIVWKLRKHLLEDPVAFPFALGFSTLYSAVISQSIIKSFMRLLVSPTTDLNFTWLGVTVSTAHHYHQQAAVCSSLSETTQTANSYTVFMPNELSLTLKAIVVCNFATKQCINDMSFLCLK